MQFSHQSVNTKRRERRLSRDRQNQAQNLQEDLVDSDVKSYARSL